MSGEIKAADRAVVVNFEKRTKQATAPAARAPSSNTSPKEEADVAPGSSLCRRPVVADFQQGLQPSWPSPVLLLYTAEQYSETERKRHSYGACSR